MENSMLEEVAVFVNGKKRKAFVGQTLSEAVKREKPCGGHGKCGKCKVVARGALSELSDTEKRLLTQAEISRGVRLACMTKLCGECEVFEETDRSAQILTSSNAAIKELDLHLKGYGAAIDIGTTTLAATLFNKNGKRVAECARLNPQSRWGADVVSRIEASMSGERGEIASSIREVIDDMLCELASVADALSREIDRVVITGNTVMLALLCGDDTEPFSHAPFSVTRLYGETVSPVRLGLASLSETAEIYLPPCISAFVGADTVCALISTELCESERALLADIGTNGEIAIYSQGKLTVCSTAAGPAFEGVGISMGMRGEVGAIDKVSLANGSLICHTIGEGTPVGICGSGLVDAIACMLRSEMLDESGYLEDDPTYLDGSVSLTQRDIRMVQLAKSAICAGICALAAATRTELSAIDKFYIAGGFGNYLNMKSSVAVGLLPRELGNKTEAVGNAALAGAEMLLLNDSLRESAERIGRGAELLELSTDPIFSEKYMMGMSFEEA